MPTCGPHFFCAAPVDGEALLEGDEARHLAAVLRARPGDPVSLADGTGAVHQATVSRVEAARVRLTVQATAVVPAPAPRVTVVQALPKGRKADDVVKRITELGADRYVAVHSARSPVRLDGARADRARRRWQAVALAASKQSRRPRPMAIDPVGEWPGRRAAAGVVLWEDADRPLREVLDDGAAAGPEVAVVVGPEGGLTPEEVAATGLPAASLGAQIMRTETAAVVAAAVVLHRVGRLG